MAATSRTRRANGAGSVFYRKDRQRYCAQATVDGKLVTRSAPTFEEAERLLEALQRSAAMAQLSLSPRQSVRQYLNYWLGWKERRVRPWTYTVYLCRLQHVVKALGTVPLMDLRPAHIDGLYTSLSATKKPATVNAIHVTFKEALQHAVNVELLSRNPASAVTPPRPTHRVRRRLSDDDLHRLLAVAAETEWRPLWLLLGTMGLRIGEALGLTWASIDWANRRITISATVSRRRGGTMVLGDPKTEKSNRMLEADDVVMEALRAQRLRTGFTEMVFPHPRGGLMDRERAARALAQQCKQAEIPIITPHELRHTFASSQLEAGTPYQVVQEVLGHASVKETIDTYGHTTPGMHRQAMEAMQRRLKEAK